MYNCDRLNLSEFDRLVTLDGEGREAKSELLREAGVPEEVIAQLCSPGIKAGMTLGGARPIDVMTLVERVLFGQHAGSVLIRVSRPPHDGAGHVEITVLEIGPPAEQGEEGEGPNPQGPTTQEPGA